MANTRIYKAKVTTPFGIFLFAVDSTAQDVRADIMSVASADMNCHPGMLRIKEVKQSNRRILGNMAEIKGAQGWAWMKRA